MRVHVIFLLIYVVFGSALPGEYTSMLLVVQCILGFILDKETFQKNQVATPLNLFYAVTVLITVSNILLINKVDSPTNITYAWIVKDYIDISCLIWSVGCTVFAIGYLIFKRFSFPSVVYIVNDDINDKIFYFVLTIAILLPALKSLLSILGSLQSILRLPALMAILYFARMWSSTGLKKYGVYAMTMFLVQTIIALNLAYLRYELIVPSITFFIGYFSGQKKIGSFISYKIVPFLLVFGFYAAIVGSLGNVRGDFASGIADLYFSDNADDAKVTYDEDKYSEDRGGILDRSAVLAQITCVVKMVNDNGFYDGAASAPMVIALVPRVLWPDKPAIRLGTWFALSAGLAFKNDEGIINNSVNMTIPGQMYLDFGWMGVVIGCLLFGGFMSMVWNAIGFFVSPYNIIGMILGGYTLLTSITSVSVDLQILVTMLSVYLTFLTIKKLLPKLNV